MFIKEYILSFDREDIWILARALNDALRGSSFHKENSSSDIEKTHEMEAIFNRILSI
jgi:hypothetical protein